MATRTRRLADLLANIDDNSKVTSAGLLDATITAADLADDSVGAAEIIDDAVGAAAIADNAVGAAAIASNAVTSAKVADNAVTGAKIAADTIEVKPHIKPGTLYPAWEGFLEDNSQYTFTDYSANGLAVTPYGDSARHTTARKKNHSSSIKLNGITDYITVADDADFDWGTGDFTVEMWFMPYGAVGSAEVLVASNNSGTTDSEFYLRSENGRLNWARGSDNLSGGVSDFNTLDTWYHVAVVNASGTITVYKNGTALYNFSAGSHDYNPTEGFSIGARKTGGAYSQFGQYYLDDIRVVKGLAVYTGNFTAPTGPLTATWAANPFGGANTAANADANKIACLIQSKPTGVHSGAYGTAQSNGKKYYYTDIEGSKPINDPRIGAHYGSQRHKFKSMQRLDQESAIHGDDVYSIDGREWMRAVGTWVINNNQRGTFTENATLTVDNWIEIVGYFNDANILQWIHTAGGHDSQKFKASLNGAIHHENNFGATHVSKLDGRFVECGSLKNITFASTPTLGINTIRISNLLGGQTALFGVELITHDTGSTARRNHVNIPAQNVVSYGKKFSIGSDTLTNAVHKHYNPFAFKTDGTTAWASGAHNGTSWPVGTGSSHNIDTATSLGLENWKHSNNYYKPYNGGRVVRWVANDGTIKTSVNVMPPNARNIKGIAVAAKANASVANNTYLPTFEAGAPDYSLAEVAKLFHIREYGNGSANGGTGGSYKDISMVHGTQEARAFVMADGLTSFAGNVVKTSGSTSTYIQADNGYWHTTFIGTGISIIAQGYGAGKYNIATNLPYGTHVLKCTRDGDGTPDYIIDGVAISDVTGDTYGDANEISIDQPKMPPIPEDAVVIADYMLMADYVKATAADSVKISKGMRLLSTTRDVFADTSAGSLGALSIDVTYGNFGWVGQHTTGDQSAGVIKCEIPAFTSQIETRTWDNRGDIYIDGTNVNDSNVGSGAFSVQTQDTASTLGVHTVGARNNASNNLNCTAIGVVSPIHTSSHYQAFETPFIYELIGGDRNMEQHNLIVTPDGKSWDEVTRDTSYIGNCVFNGNSDTSWGSSDVIVLDELRGQPQITGRYYFNKDIAIAHNCYVCLVDGQYEICSQGINDSGSATDGTQILKNGTVMLRGHFGGSSHTQTNVLIQVSLKRGDYIQFKGQCHENDLYAGYHITRI